MAQYADNFIDRLHLVWGAGFLSPGGAEEVAEVCRGLDLRDATVLDIGCGTGGPSIALARDMGACVIGIDIEPQLLDRASILAHEAGVADLVEFRLVTPGPLSFEDDRFDAVFSKDALIHIPDKQALYAEIMRVLKPGGALAASDWLSGENADDDAAFQHYLSLVPLDYNMATARQTADVMRQAGFEQVETRDRNAWYAELSPLEVARIEGPLREKIIGVSDAETYEKWLAIRRALAAAAQSGGLRPTHLRGYNP
ncbi:MAG: methyltransferase domain-containing protein [Anderseniella sp.]